MSAVLIGKNLHVSSKNPRPPTPTATSAALPQPSRHLLASPLGTHPSHPYLDRPLGILFTYDYEPESVNELSRIYLTGKSPTQGPTSVIDTHTKIILLIFNECFLY